MYTSLQFKLYFSRMDTTRIIIASDSRGRQLNEFIRQNKSFEELGEHSFQHILRPGSKIATLGEHIMQKLQLSQSYNITTHITLLAGICNFTEKVHIYDSHHRIIGTQIIYQHKPSNTRNIIDQLNSISHRFNNTTTTLSIGTIPPANLQKHTDKEISKGKLNNGSVRKYSNGELSLMQTDLENDVRAVNSAICAINAFQKLATIRWDRDMKKTVTKHRGGNKQNALKVRKFMYTHLPDGVHADDFLRQKWFKVACTTIVSNIKDHQHVQQQLDEPVQVTVDMAIEEADLG